MVKKYIKETIKKHGKTRVVLSLMAVKITFTLLVATVYYFYFYE
jgi:hypothetical protein